MVGPDAAAVLGRVAFGVFAPALLFRTTAGIAVARLPWGMLAAYFVPTVALLLAVYTWQRTRPGSTWPLTRPTAGPSAELAEVAGSDGAGPPRRQPAVPAVRALSMSFSNTVQLGIPVVTALFGAAGLAVLVAIISLQALVLLT